MKHIDRRQIQTIFHYRQKKPSQRTGPRLAAGADDELSHHSEPPDRDVL